MFAVVVVETWAFVVPVVAVAVHARRGWLSLLLPVLIVIVVVERPVRVVWWAEALAVIVVGWPGCLVVTLGARLVVAPLVVIALVVVGPRHEGECLCIL